MLRRTEISVKYVLKENSRRHCEFLTREENLDFYFDDKPR